jgi:hypothetical protein
MEVVTAERGESNHLPLRRESGSVRGGGRGKGGGGGSGGGGGASEVGSART